MGGDAFRLGRWQPTAGWMTLSHLPVYRDQLRAQRSATSMGELYLGVISPGAAKNKKLILF